MAILVCELTAKFEAISLQGTDPALERLRYQGHFICQYTGEEFALRFHRPKATVNLSTDALWWSLHLLFRRFLVMLASTWPQAPKNFVFADVICNQRNEVTEAHPLAVASLERLVHFAGRRYELLRNGRLTWVL